MSEESIAADRVLIVPGYTDAEILQMASNESTEEGEESTTTNTEVAAPASFYIEAKNIEYTPHIKSYEEFNSAEGLILIEKACDRYAEVGMDVFVHQNLSNMEGSVIIDGETKEARIRVTDNSTVEDNDKDDELQLGRYIEPSEFTDEYLEVRNAFFEDLYGRPLTIVSPLFPAMPVAYLTECTYNINEGEEEATYNVTFRETDNTGF